MLNVSWLITRSVGNSVVVNLVDVVHVCCEREAAVSTVTCTNMHPHRSDLSVHAGPEVDQSPLLGCSSAPTTDCHPGGRHVVGLLCQHLLIYQPSSFLLPSSSSSWLSCVRQFAAPALFSLSNVRACSCGMTTCARRAASDCTEPQRDQELPQES